jgi:DNA/RNA-binding protein KIN17
MLVFAENPGRFIGGFNREFLSGFLKVLSSRHGSKRVFANAVYQEYISDKNHLHMNATRWDCLGSFVRFLGKEKICEVEETEKGWYIRWIDNSPGSLERKRLLEKKEKADLKTEEMQQKQLEMLVERAQQAAATATTIKVEETELQPQAAPISLSIQPIVLGGAIVPKKRLSLSALARQKETKAQPTAEGPVTKRVRL